MVPTRHYHVDFSVLSPWRNLYRYARRVLASIAAPVAVVTGMVHSAKTVHLSEQAIQSIITTCDYGRQCGVSPRGFGAVR